jgi:hypothetical protein
METYMSIFYTQIPIALGCIWMAYEMHMIRKSFERIEKKIRK